MGYLASILLKALESGRIEERLAHLEAVMSGKRGSETEAFEFQSAKESHNEQSSTAPKSD
jgi:hypothetical protein